MWKSIFAIALGTALGALLRWLLGLKLNTLFPTISPGTLAASLILPQRGRVSWVLASVAVRVQRPLTATFAGIATVTWERSAA